MVDFGASGVTTTQSAEKAAKGSGDEIEASNDLEQPDMVLLSSGKNVPRTGDIRASKHISAADTRSLSAIKTDSNQFSQGKQDQMQSLKGKYAHAMLLHELLNEVPLSFFI